MARTLINGGSIAPLSITRGLLNIATAGSAVITKLISGTSISTSCTGADAGTGDVTITLTSGITSVQSTSYNASSGAYPSTGGRGVGGAPLKGDMFCVSVAGTIAAIGDTLVALIDTPGQTAANWIKYVGSVGATGNSLMRPTTVISSSGGVVTVDLSLGKEIYLLTLTENVTTWTFTNTPASGLTAEVAFEITQSSTTAYTCVTPATIGRNAGTAWTNSQVLGVTEGIGIRVSSANIRTVWWGGVFS